MNRRIWSGSAWIVVLACALATAGGCRKASAPPEGASAHYGPKVTELGALRPIGEWQMGMMGINYADVSLGFVSGRRLHTRHEERFIGLVGTAGASVLPAFSTTARDEIAEHDARELLAFMKKHSKSGKSTSTEIVNAYAYWAHPAFRVERNLGNGTWTLYADDLSLELDSQKFTAALETALDDLRKLSRVRPSVRP